MAGERSCAVALHHSRVYALPGGFVWYSVITVTISTEHCVVFCFYHRYSSLRALDYHWIVAKCFQLRVGWA